MGLIQTLPLILLLLGPGDGPRKGWTRQELTLPGDVWTVIGADEDGDGLGDVIVAHDSPDGPRISLFRERPEGFPDEPDETWAPPPGAIALIVEDIRPGRGAEIATMHADGVTVHLPPSPGGSGGGDPEGGRAGGRTFLRWAEGESFFRFPPDAGIPRWDLAGDVDGDGLREILFPVPYGYRLLEDGSPEGGEHPFLRVPTSAKIDPVLPSRYQGRIFTSQSSIARPVIRDIDGDGRLDIAVIHGGAFLGFVPDAEGRFSPRATLNEDLVSVERLGTQSLGRARLQLRDVSGDGKADLLVTRTIGKIGLFETLRTHIALFHGEGDGTFPATPSQIILLKGVSIDPRLADFDGDGDPDLFVSALRTDLLSNIKNVVVQWVKVTYQGYENDGAGRFPPQPTLTFDVEIPVRAIEQGSTVPFAWFEGDFDGDGTSDVFSVDGPNELAAYRGRRVGPRMEFDRSSPVFRLLGRTSNQVQLVDFTGDGRSDALLHFPRDEERRDLVVLIISPPEGQK